MTEPSTEETTPPRRRRWWLWIPVGLLVGTLVATHVMLRTDFGLEIIRGIAEDAGNDALLGDLRIGRIHGDALSTLRIDDLRIRDTAGRDAVVIDALNLSWRPAALISGIVEVSEIMLVRPRVRAVMTSSGTLNLATLVPPSPPDPTDPLPLDLPHLILEALRVEDGTITYEGPDGPATRLDALRIDLGAEATGDEVQVDLRSLSARALEAHPILLRTRARLVGHDVFIEDLELDAASARVAIPELHAPLPLGRLRGRIQVDLPARLAATLGGPEGLVAPLDLDLKIRREPEPGRWLVGAEGRLAKAPMSLSATVSEDLSTIRTALAVTKLDPSKVHTQAPPGRVRVQVKAEADLSSPTQPKVTASVTVNGRVRPPGQPDLTIAPLVAHVALAGSRARVRLDANLGAAKIRARAVVSDPLVEPHVRRSTVRLDVPDIAALVGKPARGRFSVTASASGALDDLSAEGVLTATAAGWGQDVDLSGVRARWALHGLPVQSVGQAELHVGRSRVGDRIIDGLDADVVAQQVEGATQIDIANLELNTQGLRWRGSGARVVVAPDGALTVRDLGLRSSAGILELSADLDKRANGTAEIDLQRLDLASIPRGTVPELGSVEGRVDLHAQVDRRGRTVSADVTLQGTQLRIDPARPALGVDARVRLRPTALVVSATVAGDGVGAIHVNAISRPPRDMTSADEWQARLSSAPIESAAVIVRELRLGGVQDLAGEPTRTTGRIDGTLIIEGRPATARLEITGRSLRAADLDAHGNLRIAAGFEPGRAFVRGRLRGPPFGRGTFTATAAAPNDLFDVDQWLAMRPSAVQGARVDVVGVKLDLLDRVGLMPGLGGRIDAQIVAGAGAKPLQAQIDLQDFESPWTVGLWSTQVRLRLDDTALQALGDATLNGRSVAEVDLRVPLPIDDFLTSPGDQLLDAPLQVRLGVRALPLSALRAITHLPDEVLQGELTVTATVTGSANEPIGEARLRVDDLKISEVPLPTATATATFADRQARAWAHLADGEGGALDLDARADLETSPQAIDARARAGGLDLGFLARLGVLPVGLDGRLFADVAVTGDVQTPEPTGWVEVKKMRVVFPQAALQPIQGGKARLDIQPESARLSVTGASGGGSVDVEATASLPRGEPISFQATTHLKRYPVAAGSLVRVDLTAEAVGESGPEGTDVQVTLTKGLVRMPDEKVEDLHPIEALDDVVYVDRLPGGTGGRTPVVAKPSNQPPISIKIATRSPIDMRGGPVVAALATDLRATVANGRSSLLGRAYATEGAITLFRRRYVIERAEVVFEGRDPPDPRVNVRLRHDFSTMSFTVLIQGTLAEPDLRFESSPARYSQGELLSIFLGTAPEELGQKDDRSVQGQAVGAVAGFIVGKLQREIGRALPIDTLDVELGDTSTGGAGTRVTLGKWITRQLFVAYRYKFEANTQEENDNEAVIQYRFLPGWMLEVVLGLTRNDADLIWTKRF